MTIDFLRRSPLNDTVMYRPRRRVMNLHPPEWMEPQEWRFRVLHGPRMPIIAYVHRQCSIGSTNTFLMAGARSSPTPTAAIALAHVSRSPVSRPGVAAPAMQRQRDSNPLVPRHNPLSP